MHSVLSLKPGVTVSQGLLQIRLMSTGDQIAYGFTKPLPIRQLESFRRNLNLDKV